LEQGTELEKLATHPMINVFNPSGETAAATAAEIFSAVVYWFVAVLTMKT